MAIFGKNKTDESVVKEEKTTEVKKTVKKTVVKKDAKQTSMKDLYGDKKSVTTSDKKETETKKKLAGFAYEVLVKPLITEKAANLGKENKYVFEVKKSANKIEIAKAIEETYSIKPTSVNVSRVNGKKVRSGKRVGVRRDWKKAVITLPEGKTIKIYEGV